MQLPRPPYLATRFLVRESRYLDIKARNLLPSCSFSLFSKERSRLQEQAFQNTRRNFTTRLICRVSNRNDLTLCTPKGQLSRHVKGVSRFTTECQQFIHRFIENIPIINFPFISDQTIFNGTDKICKQLIIRIVRSQMQIRSKFLNQSFGIFL